jgi:colicin import membrane protein
MTRITTPKPSVPQSVDSGRTPYGWRYVRRKLPDGTEESVEVPLTVEDLLHPQEGDFIPENSLHSWERAYLYQVIGTRVGKRPAVRVFSDCIINWGVPGLRNHSPDISVFGNVRDREKIWKTFPVAKQKARPLLVVEIVSPDNHDPRRRANDIEIKVKHYQRAGVPLYIIVDQEKENGPRRLLGYRKKGKSYVPLVPDEQGRLLLEPIGILLGLRDDRIVCYDAATGEEIPDYGGLERALADAEQRAAAARRQAEAERALAEAAQRQASAERALAEAAQRQAGAQRALAEAAQREAEAQRARAEAEANARAALEARVRDLERRNGASPGSGPSN